MIKDININNHPQRNFILGMVKEQLINRKRYVSMAVDNWKANKYNAESEFKKYNINYFKIECKLIERALANNAT